MTTDLQSAPKEAYGSWGRRVAAYLVDGTLMPLLVAAPFLALAVLVVPVSEGLAIVVGSIGYVGVIVFLVDQLVRQGKYGATVGKWLLGLRLSDAGSRRPVGVVRSLVRPVVHIIDALPLYAGYLAPLVDRRKQTFTDKALTSVVLRVAAPRTGALLPALVLASAALMIAGSIAVLGDRYGDDLAKAETEDPVAVFEAGPPLPQEELTPPPVAPASTLPPEDLEGRLAPVAEGFEPVPDDQTGLGPLDVRRTAELGGGSPEQVAEGEAGLTELGLQEAFARGYVKGDLVYSVIVYRFGTPQEALAFTGVVGENNETRQTTVPGAVVYDSGGDTTAPTGLFARGSYAYEVTATRQTGQVTDADLTPLLQRQYETAASID